MALLRAIGLSGLGALNPSSPAALGFISSSFDDKYFDHSTSVDTSEVTVKKAGDVLVCAHVPTKYTGTGGNVRYRPIFKVRKGGTADSTNGYGASSYLRATTSGNDHSSGTVYTMVSCAADDVLEVYNEAGTTQADTCNTDGLYSVYMRHLDEDSVFRATATQTNAASSPTNLNQAAAELEWNTPDRDDADYSWSSGTPEDIEIDTTGEYFVFVSIPMTSTGARVSVKGTLLKNGSAVPDTVFNQGYIRNTNSDDEASIHLTAVLSLTDTDTLSVQVEKDATASTTTTTPTNYDAEIIIIKVHPHDKLISVSDGDTLDSGGSDYNPTSMDPIEFDVEDYKDGDYWTHSNATNPERLTVSAVGTIVAGVNASLTSSAQRPTPRTGLYKNGSPVAGAYHQHAYIRNNGGHADASNSGVSILTVSAVNDIFTIDALKPTSNGTGTVNIVSTTQSVRAWINLLTSYVDDEATAVTAQAATVSASGDVTEGQTTVTGDIDADAQTASITTSADLIRDAEPVAPQAQSASITITADVIREVTTAAPQAQSATVATSADLVRNATSAPEAVAASVTTDADKVLQASPTPQAQSASVTASGDVIREAAAAPQAQSATISTTADVIRNAASAPTAQATSTSIDADAVRQTSSFAVTAQIASITVDADWVVSTSAAVSAQVTSIAIDADSIKVVTSAAPASAAAEADAEGDVIEQAVSSGDLVASAQATAIALDADVIRQGSPTPGMQGATVASAATRISEASGTPAADPTSITVGAAVLRQGSVAVSAVPGSVGTDVDLLRPGVAAVTAQAAAAALSGLHVAQGDLATTSSSSASAAALRVPQGPLAASAAAATVAMAGDVGNVVSGALSASAQAAALSVDVDLIREGAAAGAAQSASTAFTASYVRQGTSSVQGSSALAGAGLRVVQGLSTVSSPQAGISAEGEVEAPANGGPISASAQSASAALSGTLIRTAASSAQAPQAQAGAAGQGVRQGGATPAADRATVDITTGFLAEGPLGAVAGASTVVLGGSYLRQGALTASNPQAGVAGTVTRVSTIIGTPQADPATGALAGLRVDQGDLLAASQPGTVVMLGAFTVEVFGDRNVQAQPASVLFDVDVLTHGPLVAVARSAIVKMTDAIFLADCPPPAVVFVERYSYDVVVPSRAATAMRPDYTHQVIVDLDDPSVVFVVET